MRRPPGPPALRSPQMGLCLLQDPQVPLARPPSRYALFVLASALSSWPASFRTETHLRGSFNTSIHPDLMSRSREEVMLFPWEVMPAKLKTFADSSSLPSGRAGHYQALSVLASEWLLCSAGGVRGSCKLSALRKICVDSHNHAVYAVQPRRRCFAGSVNACRHDHASASAASNCCPHRPHCPSKLFDHFAPEGCAWVLNSRAMLECRLAMRPDCSCKPAMHCRHEV